MRGETLDEPDQPIGMHEETAVTAIGAAMAAGCERPAGEAGDTVTTSTFSAEYLQEAATILEQIDRAVIERIADMLVRLRETGGRLFFLGVGGGAGHASHAVNDFRKIGGIEAYTPVDNVSELTARTNDEGWDTTFVEWLRRSRVSAGDMVFVFSVGGGSPTLGVSMNIVNALDHARAVGAKIVGVVGRDGGYTASVADACVIVPTVNPATVTAHTEEMQAVVWHLLVSHPRVQVHGMKWESIDKPTSR